MIGTRKGQFKFTEIILHHQEICTKLYDIIETMNYKLSKHAMDVMSSRNVKEEWVDFTLKNPTVYLTIKLFGERNFF